MTKQTKLIIGILAVVLSLCGCNNGGGGPSGNESVTNQVSDAQKGADGTAPPAEGNGIQLPDGGASSQGPAGGAPGSPKGGK